MIMSIVSGLILSSDGVSGFTIFMIVAMSKKWRTE